MMTTNHKNFRSLLQRSLGQGLSAQEQQELEAHRHECSQCRGWAREQEDLWTRLGDAEQPSVAPTASVWPEVRRRTLEAPSGSEWFFGRGKILRTGLATSALACGLMLGILVPGMSGTANAVDTDEEFWMDESSWLDDSDTGSLSELWLNAAELQDESDGS